VRASHKAFNVINLVHPQHIGGCWIFK